MGWLVDFSHVCPRSASFLARLRLRLFPSRRRAPSFSPPLPLPWLAFFTCFHFSSRFSIRVDGLRLLHRLMATVLSLALLRRCFAAASPLLRLRCAIIWDISACVARRGFS